MSGEKKQLGPGELAAKWLLKNNQVQREWAYRYLIKRRFPFSSTPSGVPQYAWLKAEFEQQPDTMELRFLFQKMKKAWSQKKLRSKGGGRKAHTYILSQSFGKKLGRLAKKHKLPAWQMLEKILKDYEGVQNDLNLIGSVLKKELDLDEREESIKKQEAEIKRQFSVIEKRESGEIFPKVQFNNVEYVSREKQELVSQLLEEFEHTLLELATLKGDGRKIIIKNRQASDHARKAIRNRLKKYADLK